jgi:hypothetical protein
VHRSAAEKLVYLAIYQCRKCHDLSTMPRRYRYHFGERCRCPKCGSFRVSRLKGPDTIESFHTGFLNLAERLVGGGLFHCKFCRLQFYDRRRTGIEIERTRSLQPVQDGQNDEAPPPAT